MQREVNYTEALMVFDRTQKALEAGVTPVKTPLVKTLENLSKVMETFSDELEQNFEKFVIKDESGEPLLKDTEKTPNDIGDYQFTDEEEFNKNAKEIMETRKSVEFVTASPTQDVITNSGRKYSLTEFLEYSIAVPAQVAMLITEYYIEK